MWISGWKQAGNTPYPVCVLFDLFPKWGTMARRRALCHQGTCQPLVLVGVLAESMKGQRGFRGRAAQEVANKKVDEMSKAKDHFLATVNDWQMGIVWYTDIFEEIAMKIDEKGPMATAAAMWRDVLDIGALM